MARGGGLAADPDGNIYFLTGNGRAELDNSNYADAFLKLTISADSLVPSAFVPGPPVDPDPDQLEPQDADLGSGGPLVLPGFNFVIGGGKSGWMYLLDRTSMNLQRRLTASTNLYNPPERWQHWDTGPHLHGSPSLWQRSGVTDLYVWGEKDKLRQFRFDPGANRFLEPELHAGAVSALPKPMPGGMTSISANGNTPLTGVVWATLPVENIEFGDIKCRLYAFAAEDLKPLWDAPYGLCGHWAPPTVADARVFVVTGDQNGYLVGYKLGPPGNRTNWPPFQATFGLTACTSCHTAAQLADLERRWPLRRRFENEASVTVLPALAARLSSPPDDSRKLFVLEGNGFRTWRAEEARGGTHKLVWTLRETTADLTTASENGEPSGTSNANIRVHLGPGWIWTAADGSSVSGKVVKTIAAPQRGDIRWTLFRAQPNGRGVLSGVRYIRLVKTHAGRPPTQGPARLGAEVKAPFYAQYWVYQ